MEMIHLIFIQMELEKIGGIGENLRGCITDVVLLCRGKL